MGAQQRSHGDVVQRSAGSVATGDLVVAGHAEGFQRVRRAESLFTSNGDEVVAMEVVDWWHGVHPGRLIVRASHEQMLVMPIIDREEGS